MKEFATHDINKTNFLLPLRNAHIPYTYVCNARFVEVCGTAKKYILTI